MKECAGLQRWHAANPRQLGHLRRKQRGFNKTLTRGKQTDCGKNTHVSPAPPPPAHQHCACLREIDLVGVMHAED